MISESVPCADGIKTLACLLSLKVTSCYPCHVHCAIRYLDVLQVVGAARSSCTWRQHLTDCVWGLCAAIALRASQAATVTLSNSTIERKTFLTMCRSQSKAANHAWRQASHGGTRSAIANWHDPVMRRASSHPPYLLVQGCVSVWSLLLPIVRNTQHHWLLQFAGLCCWYYQRGRDTANMSVVSLPVSVLVL